MRRLRRMPVLHYNGPARKIVVPRQCCQIGEGPSFIGPAWEAISKGWDVFNGYCPWHRPKPTLRCHTFEREG